MIVVACILTFNYFIQFISRIFALTITLLIFFSNIRGHNWTSSLRWNRLCNKTPPCPIPYIGKRIRVPLLPWSEIQITKITREIVPRISRIFPFSHFTRAYFYISGYQEYVLCFWEDPHSRYHGLRMVFSVEWRCPNAQVL